MLFDDAAYPRPTATVIARQFKAGTPTYDGFATVGGGTKYGNISESAAERHAGHRQLRPPGQLAQTALINSFSATETGKGTGTIGGSDTLLGCGAEAWVKTSSHHLGRPSGIASAALGGCYRRRHPR